MEIIKQEKTKTNVRKTSMKVLNEKELRVVAYARVSTDHDDQKNSFDSQQKYLWIMNLSGAILNIVLNLLLIPVYNIMGAAIASLITQIFTNVIIGFIIKPIRKNNNLMIKALDIRILKNIFLKKI